jgi:hypothetical protein
MGYESEIIAQEIDNRSHVIFENNRVYFRNESDSEDDEFDEEYEEAWTDTVCEEVERNFYAEALDDPVRKRYRNMPWIWATELMEKQSHNLN